MTPLEISQNNVITNLGSLYQFAVSFTIVAALVLLYLLMPYYIKKNCLFGHSYQMKEAVNNNGIWTVKRECEYCGQKLEEITDTAHFRIGRT